MFVYCYLLRLAVDTIGDPELVNKEFIETLEEYALNSYKLLQRNKDTKHI